MNDLWLFLASAVVTGIGATFVFDLWGLILKIVFRVAPSSVCLVGRWVRYMPDGVFTHANIRAAQKKSGECTVGWVTHYLIGITFAAIFIALAGGGWLQRPTLVPALVFGVVTVLAPLLILQPAFGFGIAASKTPNPAQARLRSLMNHTAFGLGLYLFGWLAAWLR